MKPLRAGDPVMVGKYRLVGRLGTGGMGQVYQAVTRSGRTVAVKVIRPEYADSGNYRNRFAREVAAAKRVGGFHTAEVIDADPDADPPWMVTAFISGPNLRNLVTENGPLSLSEVRRLGAGLAEALEDIHGCGLVHRDLKPGNVLMHEDGPRVIDFGIARFLDLESATPAGDVLGTYAYMSPEQAKGCSVGPPSDVFSLASILVFAATGHSPFAGPSTHEVLQSIVSGEPELAAICDNNLRNLLSLCFSKSPEMRPTASDLLTEFTTDAAQPDSTQSDSTNPDSTQPDRTNLDTTPYTNPWGAAPEPSGSRWKFPAPLRRSSNRYQSTNERSRKSSWPACERLWMFLRVRWEEQGRPTGHELSREADRRNIRPALPRTTVDSWIQLWEDPVAKHPFVPKNFDLFFTFVRVLGAEQDLDRELDLLVAETDEQQWRHVYEDALQEAGDAWRNRARTTRQSKRTLHRKDVWRGSVTGLIGSIGAAITTIILSSGGNTPLVEASSKCVNVIDHPAGVYPSPDERKTPIKFKMKGDRVVVLSDASAASAGWVEVFTPKDQPGYHWMIASQLGPQQPC